ncbi:hypothetical protein HU200_038014 [Digitaria exilis]|uniref:Uncharacterized protein n=1 Tax=Digitaria exilis TaxID=1010633 RepID=A0A835EIY8_9POAL|nr:hypothetical protein HU200_038014 [Digitaria exilis]
MASASGAGVSCVLRIRPPPPAWTPEEDAVLERLARENGARRWCLVVSLLPGRSPRECRGRWRHHLARDVYHRPFTAGDDDDLARLYVRHGGRWRDMSRAAHGRTSRAMRRRWREIRDTDALLSRLWRPRPPASPPPPQQPFPPGSNAVAPCGPGRDADDDTSHGLAAGLWSPSGGSVADVSFLQPLNLVRPEVSAQILLAN